MSYFTDDTPYKSNMEPLVVDNNNLPSEELGLWEQNEQRYLRRKNSDVALARQGNLAGALEERSRLLEEELGPDYVEKLKDFGYEPGLLGPAGDPWLSTGREEAFETAVENFRNILPAEKRSKLYVGDEVERAAKEYAKRVEAETAKKLENTKYGWWAGIFGDIAAHATDPLELAVLGFLPNAIAGRFLAKAGQASLAKRAGIYAGTEAGVAATFETPNQFLNVKPYKNELGIKYTNQDAANAVLAATVLSAVFAGTFEFGAGAFRKVATGEWTPQQAKQHLGENYDNLTPEQKEMVDMALQAQEHELANPYGPSVEGRKQHNKEAYEATKHAHSTGRKVSDDEIFKAQEAIKPRDELAELQELRAQAIKDAGIQDPLIRVEEPEAPITQQPEVNPLEAQFRSLTDGLEVGDELAVSTLTRAGLDEAEVRSIIDYAVRSGILTKDADGKITIAKRVDDPDNPVVDGDSRLEELEARQLESEGTGLSSLKGKDEATKINTENEELGPHQFRNLQKNNPEIYYDLTQLRKDAERILPDDVTTLFPMFMDGSDGSFSRATKTLRVARDHPNIETTLRHEALHAMRSRISSNEWKMLVEASRKISFPKEEQYTKHISKIYEDFEHSEVIPNLIRDNLNEERVANLIEYAYNGGDISMLEPKPRSFIEKAVKWIKAVLTTLKAPKYDKLRKFLEDFESGAIAKRAERDDINYYTESYYSLESKGSQDEFTINIDGEELTPEQLIKSADDDMAMAENVKLCAMMGG